MFFTYPGVGFNNKYILFENLYSIATHFLAFCMSLLIITLGFAKFEIKNCWKEALCFLGLFCYVLLEIFVLKIEDDPMYFMPGNDIVEILNVGYGWFVFLYILVLLIYCACFYLIGDRKTIFRKKRKLHFCVNFAKQHFQKNLRFIRKNVVALIEHLKFILLPKTFSYRFFKPVENFLRCQNTCLFGNHTAFVQELLFHPPHKKSITQIYIKTKRYL